MSLLQSVLDSIDKKPSQLVSSLFEHSGGIESLLNKFKSEGLGEAVQSWISTGANMPVTSEQIHKALGSDLLTKVAEKAGVEVSTITAQLEKYLPQVIDKMSPNGKLTHDA